MDVSSLLHAIERYDDEIGLHDSDSHQISREVAQHDVTRVVNDHRKADGSSLFVALTGTTTDSHHFLGEAHERGAITMGECSSDAGDVPDILVRSSRAALGPLAHELYGAPTRDMTLVGVTGTNGKTTVSYLYSSVIRATNNHCFVMGTTGILLDGEKETDSQTTPDPLVLHQYFADYRSQNIVNGALEVSSHAMDQKRVLGTNFAAVAFTNFTQDHLDYHQNMDEYFSAKAQLFSDVYSPHAVINSDDEKAAQLCESARAHGQDVLRVSCRDSGADVYVEVQEQSLVGTRIKVYVQSGELIKKYETSTSLIGDYNIENYAVCLGLAIVTGIDTEIAIDALRSPDGVPGRLQRPRNEKDFGVFVDYAHTPDALERVVKMMKGMARRVIVVFGCGGDRDHAKRPLMGAIAAREADVVVVTSDNPRSEDPQSIIDEICTGISDLSDVVLEVDRKKAIAHALQIASTGDAVIIAGKGHETEQVFSDRSEYFSDREVVEEILREMP